jgi:hypothetical protein
VINIKKIIHIIINICFDEYELTRIYFNRTNSLNDPSCTFLDLCDFRLRGGLTNLLYVLSIFFSVLQIFKSCTFWSDRGFISSSITTLFGINGGFSILVSIVLKYFLNCMGVKSPPNIDNRILGGAGFTAT